MEKKNIWKNSREYKMPIENVEIRPGHQNKEI